MLLAVDVGNTQTVLGLFDDERLAGHWRISTNPSLTADEMRAKVAQLLALDGFELAAIGAVAISSVVPRLTAAWEDLTRDAIDARALVVGPGIKTGMPIRYDNPQEVGADRIVNAIAALARVGSGPLIVVDFGTATTLDVVSAQGAYLGGAIAPGVETSAEALFAKAARLAKFDLEAPPRTIGTNTRQSVQAGLVLGQAVLVDGLVRRVWAELECETPVIATGGLAPVMQPLCETITAVDVDLTLEGLRILWDMNRAIGAES